MAEFAELPLSLRLFLKTYRWRRIDPVPGASLRQPLSASNIAVVTTAGFTAPGQEPFDEQVRGGDWSSREIAADSDVATLVESHRSGSFDHAGVRADPNLAFPLDRMRELVSERVIGRINHRHFSFMGSLTAPGRLVANSAPLVADALVSDAVDAVLLVPI